MLGPAAPATQETGLTGRDLTYADRLAWRRRLGWPDACEAACDTATGTAAHDVAGIAVHDLGGGEYVIEVLCSLGAYQGNPVFFDWNEATQPPTARRLSFPAFDVAGDGSPPVPAEVTELTGLTTLDPQTHQLPVEDRFRGLGDCGSLATYTFQDGQPVLREYRTKLTCDGIWQDPATWPRLLPPDAPSDEGEEAGARARSDGRPD